MLIKIDDCYHSKLCKNKKIIFFFSPIEALFTDISIGLDNSVFVNCKPYISSNFVFINIIEIAITILNKRMYSITLYHHFTIKRKTNGDFNWIGMYPTCITLDIHRCVFCQTKYILIIKSLNSMLIMNTQMADLMN